MRIFITFIFLSISLVCSGQIDLIKIAENITNEGKELYQLEQAAWNGTDIFYNSFNESQRIGGYFSFFDSGKAKCLFFSKGENPKVIGIVSFSDIKIVGTATIDFKERDFSREERILYEIRAKAFDRIQTDTLFKAYNNTSVNLIPYIKNGERKVYVLTAPKVTGTVLFGNDYLISFDKNNHVIETLKLHKNLIPVSFGNGDNVDGSLHSHAPGTSEFITPTDICTLLLYSKFAGWKKHYVVSQNYVSIWDCEKETLEIVLKDSFN